MSEERFARNALLTSVFLLGVGAWSQRTLGRVHLEQEVTADSAGNTAAGGLTPRELALRAEIARRVRERDLAFGIAVIAVGLSVLAYRRRGERARIAEELSFTDPLTGLRNRRYLDQVIAMDVATSIRRHRDAAAAGLSPMDSDLIVLMLDIDDFKAVNETYGHARGDQVLRSVAHVLRAVSRESDVVVRWGGDEFLVVGRFTDRVLATATAERMRVAIQSHVMDLPGGEALSLTCSIGFVAFPFDAVYREAVSWDHTLVLADLAAFDAKHHGGNRSIGYASAGWIPAVGERLSPQEVRTWVSSGRLLRLTRDGDDSSAAHGGHAEDPLLRLM